MKEQANPSEENEVNPEETITIKKSTLLEIKEVWFALESFLYILRQETKPFSEINAENAYENCGIILELIRKRASDEFEDLFDGLSRKR